MSNPSFDVIAIGSCYVDTNARDFPFGAAGIPAEMELVGNQYEVVPGGSAVNFCLLLKQLGLTSSFIGMAGKDPNGDLLYQLLERKEIRPALIRQPDLLTNVSFNMTNPDGAHIMLVAGTANAALHPDVVLPKLEELLPDVHALYLGGCFKLKAFAQAFPLITDMARKHLVRLVVDHGRVPEDLNDEMRASVKQLVQEATYYFPSRDEFCQLWKVEDIEEGLRTLRAQAPDLTVVVKDGENGAWYWMNDAVQHAEAVTVEKVVNATGAGDSFNAGVIAALAGETSLSEAVTYGCAVAAAKISGQVIPSWK